MIKFERTSVMNMENALRGMRNPMKSWDKTDSAMCKGGCGDCNVEPAAECPKDGTFDGDWFCMGKNDMNLAKSLRKAGSDHRKYLRQIFVSVDITAPLYWWKEFDTYKIGTVANSESTMHTIHKKEFELEDFSHEHLLTSGMDVLMRTIKHLNDCRHAFIYYDNWDNDGYAKPKAKDIWYDMIQILPTSYNQMRTVTLNYEVLINIYHARKNHKLDEWHTFCGWVESLPYAKELIIGE